MATLKKAYAEIILNTSKEAAARIMAADRRALCFQKDLFVVKEDALRMLVQLKQMLDSKVQISSFWSPVSALFCLYSLCWVWVWVIVFS